MSTKPHLTQIQSTDMGEHPHLLSELLALYEFIRELESNGIRGIFPTYEDMVAGATEVGFYNVIVDETFKNHPTGYYFDGIDFHIKYGLKSIMETIEEIERDIEEIEKDIEDIENIVDDTEELVKPKIDPEKSIVVKPGDNVIRIPLDKDDYEYKGGIVVEGAGVGDIRIEDGYIIIEIDPTNPSDEIKITIPEGSISTESGRENSEIILDIVVEGAEPLIIQNSINGSEMDIEGNYEVRFKVDYPVEPVVGLVDLTKVHTTQNSEIEFDEITEEFVVKFKLVRGKTYKIIFYRGAVVADNTPSVYLECNFKVKEPDIPEEPIDPPVGGWEYVFTLSSASSEFNLNKSDFSETIPNDLDMYGDSYRLYYLGYNGNDDPKLVPRAGFDSFSPSNPDGGFVYMSGVIIFETASLGNKVYKLVKVVG